MFEGSRPHDTWHEDSNRKADRGPIRLCFQSNENADRQLCCLSVWAYHPMDAVNGGREIPRQGNDRVYLKLIFGRSVQSHADRLGCSANAVMRPLAGGSHPWHDRSAGCPAMVYG